MAADGLSEVVFDERRRKDTLKAVGGVGCAVILVFGSFFFAGAEALPLTKIDDIKDYAVASEVMLVVTLFAVGFCKSLMEK
jgi:hypothetical protein